MRLSVAVVSLVTAALVLWPTLAGADAWGPRREAPRPYWSSSLFGIFGLAPGTHSYGYYDRQDDYWWRRRRHRRRYLRPRYRRRHLVCEPAGWGYYRCWPAERSPRILEPW